MIVPHAGPPTHTPLKYTFVLAFVAWNGFGWGDPVIVKVLADPVSNIVPGTDVERPDTSAVLPNSAVEPETMPPPSKLLLAVSVTFPPELVIVPGVMFVAVIVIGPLALSVPPVCV